MTNETTTSVNFLQVVPNSHFYTTLQQIEMSLKHDGFDKEHILIGIRNSIAQGYRMVPTEPIRKHDFALYTKGKSKKPILCQLRFIEKNGTYAFRYVDGSKWIKTKDLSRFVKWNRQEF